MYWLQRIERTHNLHCKFSEDATKGSKIILKQQVIVHDFFVQLR